MRDERRRADRAWRLLAELAERAPLAVRLLPGAGRDEIDGWGVPLPDDIRHLIGRTRALWIGGPAEESLYRLAPEGGLAPGGWAIGPPGSVHLVQQSGGDALFVDVDEVTGEWGRLFAATGHFHETWAYVASSLLDWVTGLARAGLHVLDAAEAADHDVLLERLGEAAHVFSYRPDLHGTPVPQARADADPELAAVLATLPDEAVVIDLREVAAPVTLHLPCPPGLRGGYVEFQRRAGGRFAVGLPRM
jgi:hypothetical protein